MGAAVRPVRDCPTVACWRCRLSDLDIAQFLSARLEGRLQCSDQSVPSASVRNRLARIGCARTGSSIASETRSEEHTSELQSLMRISYAVFCLNKKTTHAYDMQYA